MLDWSYDRVSGRAFIGVILGLLILASCLGCRTTLPPISVEAWRVHGVTTVVDLHVDPLFWNTDLLQRTRGMQVDVPRLKEGGVNVAIFGIVTAGLPVINGFKMLTRLRGWPRTALESPWTAANYQLRRLETLVESSQGALRLARTAQDVMSANKQGAVAIMIGIEGAQVLEGDPARVAILKDRGVFYMGPVHLSGNALGGASYPIGNTGGLTDLGRKVVDEMERVGMFIDMAHLSKTAFWEVMARTRGPVLCSHTGVQAVEASWRNLDDAQLAAIGARGGVIGIMLATNFLGGRHVSRWVAHVRHAVAVAGIEHVALGSDFDGFIPVPREVPHIGMLPQLSQALLDGGFTADEVGRIMGGNFLAMLQRLGSG